MPLVRQVVHGLLEQHGLTTIFGNPGSNELPFLADLPDSFDYVLGLHEGVVLGMADGYAQATGRPAFVNLHAASGSGNAMGAMTNAVYARTPLIVTAGQQVRSVIGMEGMLSSVDAASLMRPLARWAAEPASAGDVPRAFAQAIFEATAHRAPVYLSIPYDDWDTEVDHNAELVVTRSVSTARTPSDEQLRWLSDAVTGAQRPLLVLGGDVDSQGHFERAIRTAEALDVPVYAAPSLFRLPFPNRHPLFRGVLPAGIKPISDAFAGHDLVVTVGAPVFRYHQHVPGDFLPDGTRLIQVTDDPGAATRAPFGEALICDLAEALEALSELGTARPAPVEYAAPAEPQTADGALHPEQVFAALRDVQPKDTAYVVESTSTNSAFWSQLDLRMPGSYYFPASGGLGFGMPAAVGVGMGQPQRPVVAAIGDGSANYGITALWSAATYDIPVTFVILRNGSYGALRWFADLLGVPKAPGMDIPNIDFTDLARGYGVPAEAVTSVDELRAALARPVNGPRLIQVDTALTAP